MTMIEFMGLTEIMPMFRPAVEEEESKRKMGQPTCLSKGKDVEESNDEQANAPCLGSQFQLLGIGPRWHPIRKVATLQGHAHIDSTKLACNGGIRSFLDAARVVSVCGGLTAVDVYRDSNWARHVRTRKSLSQGAIMYINHTM